MDDRLIRDALVSLDYAPAAPVEAEPSALEDTQSENIGTVDPPVADHNAETPWESPDHPLRMGLLGALRDWTAFFKGAILGNLRVDSTRPLNQAETGPGSASTDTDQDMGSMDFPSSAEGTNAPTPPRPDPSMGVDAYTEVPAPLAVLVEAGGSSPLPPSHRVIPRSRDDVLHQSMRGQIYAHIRARPGATYTDVKRDLGLSNGGLAHHLYILEREGLVRASSEGGRKRLYPAGTLLRGNGGRPATQERLLRILAQAPGATISDVAGMLGISRQLATYHARLLAQQGLVRLERRGDRLRVVPVRGEEGLVVTVTEGGR